MVMGYGNDGRAVDGNWIAAPKEEAAAVPLAVRVDQDGNRTHIGSGLPADVHAGLVKHLVGTREVGAYVAWTPEQAPGPTDQAQFDVCPTCRPREVMASTVAMQITYFVDEPVTLHMWCIRGHAWRRNQIEGRVIEPSKWQR